MSEEDFTYAYLDTVRAEDPTRRRTPLLFTGMELFPGELEGAHRRSAKLSDLGVLYWGGYATGVWNTGWVTRIRLPFLLVLGLLAGAAVLRMRWEGTTTGSFVFANMSLVALVWVPTVVFIGGWSVSPHSRASASGWKNALGAKYSKLKAQMMALDDWRGLSQSSSSGDGLGDRYTVESDESEYDDEYEEEEEEEEEERGWSSSPPSSFEGGLVATGPKERESMGLSHVVALVSSRDAKLIGRVTWGSLMMIGTLGVTVGKVVDVFDYETTVHSTAVSFGANLLTYWFGLTNVAFFLASPLFVARRVKQIALDLQTRSVSDHLRYGVSGFEAELGNLGAFIEFAINARLHTFSGVIMAAVTGGAVLFILLTIVTKSASHLFFVGVVAIYSVTMLFPFALANSELSKLSRAIVEECGDISTQITVARRSAQAGNGSSTRRLARLLELRTEFNSLLNFNAAMHKNRVRFANVAVTFGFIKGIAVASISIISSLLTFLLQQ